MPQFGNSDAALCLFHEAQVKITNAIFNKSFLKPVFLFSLKAPTKRNVWIMLRGKWTSQLRWAIFWKLALNFLPVIQLFILLTAPQFV